jgi:tetratricopeptide (TPR) repeat protein
VGETIRAAAALAILVAPPLLAQQGPGRSIPAAQRLGHSRFPTSCDRTVQPRFDRAVAMLHSFWFAGAIREFNAVLERDPACAMAHWGIAMSNWGFRGQPVATRAGAAAIAKAEVLAGRARTPRERDYIAAAALLYKDAERVNPRTRITAYERAMADLTRRYPDDREAVLFHALAILDTVVPTDKTYAARLRAGALLEEAYAADPDHAGTAHYIIHAYDVPALAGRALEAARRYARLAPNVAHPLHMPSHVFTRLGYWEESIDSNLRSAEAAAAEGPQGAGERLHALDYAVYAYLQTAQDRAAHAIVRTVPGLARGGGAAPHHGSPNAFAAAAIPARYALERHAWTEASVLPPSTSDMPQADAMTSFARALGFARTARPALARQEIDQIAALRDALNARRDLYWAELVDVQRAAATAWASFAEGRAAEAIALLRSAAEREDATEKAGTTPGPLMPARELLGDMLIEAKRPAEALREYEAALASEPNRYRSVAGAARAALLAGADATARRYREQLARICGKGDRPGRPELQEARK